VLRNLLIIFSIFFSLSIYSQKLNEKYYLFSDENIAENLIFLNDSTLLTKPIFLGGIYIKEHYPEKLFNYKKVNDTITIFKFRDKEFVKYKVENNYLENSNRREIFIIRKDFGAFPNLALKYKEEIYWLNSAETSNSAIRNERKQKRKLKKLFNNKSTENLNLEFYNGYDAFKLFGYQFVFGIYYFTDK